MGKESVDKDALIVEELKACIKPSFHLAPPQHGGSERQGVKWENLAGVDDAREAVAKVFLRRAADVGDAADAGDVGWCG